MHLIHVVVAKKNGDLLWTLQGGFWFHAIRVPLIMSVLIGFYGGIPFLLFS
jgi:hypothetical protein